MSFFVRSRLAVPGDGAELARLRGVMIASALDQELDTGPWMQQCAQQIDTQLAGNPDFVAYVVDSPDDEGALVSCAMGSLALRIATPMSSRAYYGNLYSVCTDKDWRRLGYARSCVMNVMTWMAGRGCASVTLHASQMGEHLYSELGFEYVDRVEMRWDIPG